MTKPREKTHEEVGLDGVKLIVGDKCLGMLEAVGEVFPEAKYQRCTVHFYGGFAATRGCTPCAAYAAIPAHPQKQYIRLRVYTIFAGFIILSGR